LKSIKTHFKEIGKITDREEDVIQFRVSSINDLEVIINHFDNYPLITQKQADFILFKKAFGIVLRKEHLTPEGFQEILRIRAAMKKGLPDLFKTEYPDIIPVEIPAIIDPEIKDAH